MSIYDASHPARGDSAETKKAKRILKERITSYFSLNNRKTWIVEEAPYYSREEQKPYHLDLCILTRQKIGTYDFVYQVFAIEIDGETHDRSKIQDWKDDTKDLVFVWLGIPIKRIRVEDIVNEGVDLEALDKNIWRFYKDLGSEAYIEKNQQLATKLKENQLAYCRNPKCKHPISDHSLSGCNFFHTNKANLKCYCDMPAMVSDA
jgi:hypothetical protein